MGPSVLTGSGNDVRRPSTESEDKDKGFEMSKRVQQLQQKLSSNVLGAIQNTISEAEKTFQHDMRDFHVYAGNTVQVLSNEVHILKCELDRLEDKNNHLQKVHDPQNLLQEFEKLREAYNEVIGFCRGYRNCYKCHNCREHPTFQTSNTDPWPAYHEKGREGGSAAPREDIPHRRGMFGRTIKPGFLG